MNIDDATRQRILNLWAKGLSQEEVAAKIGGISGRQVNHVVNLARRNGDHRAANRKSRGGAAPPMPVSRDRYPDYSRMSLTGLLFGDPAPGRSALDQKRNAEACART